MSLSALVAANRVVVFTWVRCPYCVRAKQILQPIAPDTTVYELDRMENGDDLQKQIYSAYRHETVPAIFIKGKFIGGCDDLQRLQTAGQLAKLLA